MCFLQPKMISLRKSCKDHKYVAQKKGHSLRKDKGKTMTTSFSPQYCGSKIPKQSPKNRTPPFMGAQGFFLPKSRPPPCVGAQFIFSQFFEEKMGSHYWAENLIFNKKMHILNTMRIISSC